MYVESNLLIVTSLIYVSEIGQIYEIKVKSSHLIESKLR